MTDDINLDGRKWAFLNNPEEYACSAANNNAGLIREPLERQFKTVKKILSRFQDKKGVLLADDVGLGKTTVGALVAWVVACQGNRVRIYAPNVVMRRRWAEELERHVPILKSLGGTYRSIETSNILQGDKRPKPGQIQVFTHSGFINSTETRTQWELMIIDEAHRAKGEGSYFKEALSKLGNRAKRKLILTATPFSIKIAELKQLLEFVGATKLDAVKAYAGELKRLYSLGDGRDVNVESKRLVKCAQAAIEELKCYVIRHGIDDLSDDEKKHFGRIAEKPWDITSPTASEEEVKLLLRMDRILTLTQERKGERRNDPRFHIGWQHLGVELNKLQKPIPEDANTLRHIAKAEESLKKCISKPHPKIAAVIEAILPVVDAGEKVLVFCHHHATANELLLELEKETRAAQISLAESPDEGIWRTAWIQVLGVKQPIPLDIKPIIDWLCSSGIRSQVTKWIERPSKNAEKLAKQINNTKPRLVDKESEVPTIGDAARKLVSELLDPKSKSTRAVLKNMANPQKAFDKTSHFPGELDQGHRVMGVWASKPNNPGSRPLTLYTGEPDIVIKLFNSPFGPDVLVTTDYLSEGVDLHRCCRHLIHYELDPSPVRTLQRNGRIRRVGSWAALTGKPICYAYPTYGGTRDEKAVGVMRQRINAFGLLLGGVPSLDVDGDTEENESKQSLAEEVLGRARDELKKINRQLTV